MLSAPGLEELFGQVVRFHKGLDKIPKGAQNASIAWGAGGRRDERDAIATRRRESGRHDALELL